MTRFTSLFLALLLTAAGFARAEDAKPAPFKPAFFAFQNGVNFGSLENEAKTLKERHEIGLASILGEEAIKFVHADNDNSFPASNRHSLRAFVLRAPDHFAEAGLGILQFPGTGLTGFIPVSLANGCAHLPSPD